MLDVLLQDTVQRCFWSVAGWQGDTGGAGHLAAGAWAGSKPSAAALLSKDLTGLDGPCAASLLGSCMDRVIGLETGFWGLESGAWSGDRD